MTSRKDKFESRFREHYSRLCHLAYGYVADRDECEDMVQEVFISVWNSGKDSLPEDEFAAYVTTALRNRCISFLRKKCNAAVSFEDLSVLPAVEDDVSDHEGEQRSLTDFLQGGLVCAASQVPGSLPACQTAGHEIPGNCPGTGHLGKNGRESDDQGHPPLEAVCKGKSLSLVVYRLDMFNDC